MPVQYSQQLLFEKMGDVGVLQVNRPEILNAINSSLIDELLTFLEQYPKRERCKALILTGAGGKAFIAGADIREMRTITGTQFLEFCRKGQQLTLALEEAPYLTIAAVNGYALGGGLEIALACDFIYASKYAKLGFPEVSLGLTPGFGGSQRFAKAAGTRIAKELIMTGRTFSADEGRSYGIINKVCEAEALLTDCQAVAREVVRHSFTALIQAKAAINAGITLGMHEALELERNMCTVCFSTEERAKGMADFLEKRKKE